MQTHLLNNVCNIFYTLDEIEIKNQESEKQRRKMRIKMAINLQLKWSLQFVVNWCVFKLCKDHNRKGCFCELLQMRFRQRIDKISNDHRHN